MPASLVLRAALAVLSLGATRAATFTLFTDPACTAPSTSSPGTSTGGGSGDGGNLTAFFGACTDIALAYPITLTACTEGASATLSIMYPLTSTYTLPPECAGAVSTLGFMVGAVGACTPLPPALAGNFFRDAVAFKLVDAACALPRDVFYVTPPGNASCNNDPTPTYRLSTADNTCRSVLGVNYKATLGTSSPGAGGVAYTLFFDAACATQRAAWPSVPFDRSCALSAGAAGVPAGAQAGLRAVRPNAAVPPSPSASPAPYRAPLQERAAVLLTWPESNGGCDGAPDKAVRALSGVCTPSVDSKTPYDIGLTSCDASGVSFVVFNNTPATAGTCAGPVLYVGAAALGGCAFVQPYDATATNESFYVSLAAPAPCVAYAPATASLLTLYTGGSSSGGGPPPTSCAPGSPTITTLVPNTGGPGSCATEATALQTEDIARALANYSAQMVSGGDAVTIEFFNSTLPPYGCSGTGSRTGLPGAFISVAVSARDGACVPVSIFGSPSLGGRVTPATAFNGPAPAPSASPTPSFSPSTGTSPSPTPTASRTAPRTPSATPSPPPTASLTASVPASPSATPTAPSASPTPTASLSFGASPSVSPTATPSPSATPTFTPTPQPTPAAPAGAAAAADVVGPAVGGTLGGLALAGIAGAGAAVLIARRGPRSRLAGGASSWRAGSALASLNPLAKPAAAAAPAAGAPAVGADAMTWTRYVDGDDEWYLSSLGQTEWVLPAGAVVVAQPPA